MARVESAAAMMLSLKPKIYTIMNIYHMTKSTLESRLHELKAYQSNSDDDYDYCEVYQREINEIEGALCSGQCGSYVMDSVNFTKEI